MPAICVLPVLFTFLHKSKRTTFIFAKILPHACCFEWVCRQKIKNKNTSISLSCGCVFLCGFCIACVGSFVQFCATGADFSCRLAVLRRFLLLCRWICQRQRICRTGTPLRSLQSLSGQAQGTRPNQRLLL